MAFLSIEVILKTEKTWNRNGSSKLAALDSVESMSTFHSSNLAKLFCLFQLITKLFLPYINNISYYYVFLIHSDKGLTLTTSSSNLLRSQIYLIDLVVDNLF